MPNCRYCEVLSDVELECIVPKMETLLRDADSPETAINEEQMQAHLALKGLYVPMERMRFMIAFIRVNGLVAPLVWSPNGFYVSSDNEAVMRQVLELRFISGLFDAEAAALEQFIPTTTH